MDEKANWLVERRKLNKLRKRIDTNIERKL